MILKKLGIWLTALLLSVTCFSQIGEIVPKRPDPPRLVNDYTKTLTEAQLQALENKLVAYDDSTSNQIAVVIIPTLGNYTDQEVALEILRTWGVGNKDINNGIVLLVAKNDRKVRIETGYGLEGAIPDITAKSIIDNYIVPNFKSNNYYRGLDEATDAIIRAAAGEYKAPEGYRSKKGKGVSFWTVLFVFILLFIIMGAAGGAAGGTYTSRGGTRSWPGGGWWTGGGGGSSGGGWSGGGGFGGFGGGSGGGGGASGSW